MTLTSGLVWALAVALANQVPYGGFRTIAGNGEPRGDGAVNNPFAVELGPDGGLYIGAVGQHRIYRLDRKSQQLTVIAGTGKQGYSGDGGAAIDAELNEPYEIRFDSAGNLFFVERLNHTVRRIDAQTKVITTVAGTGTAGFAGDGGPALQATFNQPHSIVLDKAGHLYIADISNHRIRRVHLPSGVVVTIAGNGGKKLPVAGGKASATPVLGPRALALEGNTLWVALREGHSLWRLDLEHDRWSHAAGTGKVGFQDGPAAQATFNGPKGIALDAAGRVYIVDTENQAVRVYDPHTQQVATVGGAGPKARGFKESDDPRQCWFNRPHGICVGADGTLFLGDSENHRVLQAEVRR